MKSSSFVFQMDAEREKKQQCIHHMYSNLAENEAPKGSTMGSAIALSSFVEAFPRIRFLISRIQTSITVKLELVNFSPAQVSSA